MKKPVGLSRRDLEWIVNGMTGSLPRDPAEAHKLLLDVVMTLIDRNNAALATAFEDSQSDGMED